LKNVYAGTLLSGSAVVLLDKTYVGALSNGTYAVTVTFEDPLVTREGVTEPELIAATHTDTFVIARAKPPAPVKLSVKFSGNGGKIAGAKTKTVTVIKGNAIGKLPKAKRAKYLFKGWYTKKKGGKKITAKTKFAKNTTLYAHWKKKPKYGKVTARSLYVRKYPSKHANLLPVTDTFKRGQKFKIKAFVNNKGRSNDWYALKYKGHTVYVHARYVKVVYR
jgi:uncharacterized repeat protein (TIGR02543 family)